MDSQAPEPRSAPVPDVVSEAGSDAMVSSRGSAVRHLAILSAFLVPIACLPYLITRRQLTTLRRRVDEMGATTNLLRQRHQASAPGGESGVTALLAQMRQEMDVMRAQLEHNDSERAKSLSEMTMDVIHINEELDQIRGDILSVRDAESASPDKPMSREEVKDTLEDGLHRLRQETGSSQSAVVEQIRQLHGEQDALRSELIKMADQLQTVKTGPHAVDSTELHRLLQETRQTRAIFGAIGSSLGDVATIIQRVEIEMGHERSGGYDPVERLRILALRMQDESFQGERKGRGRG
ncbi:hypothetical protein B0H11DRAFT_1967351 [Mycena galericulata]|nr:hypothetical protein B0H11DRAFT_1967351 [Mycena galericulata]